MEAGHETPEIGWLKRPPNDGCCREAGHATPEAGVLKHLPSRESCSKETGHTTQVSGSLNVPPNDSCCRESGRRTACKNVTPQSSSSSLFRHFNRTTNSRRSGRDSTSRKYSSSFHLSTTILRQKSPPECHSKSSARTVAHDSGCKCLHPTK